MRGDSSSLFRDGTRARGRGSPAPWRFFFFGVLAAGFAFLVVSLGTLEPVASGRSRPERPASRQDRSAGTARRHVEILQAGMAQGKVYGDVDGTTRELSRDEAARMVAANEIRIALYQLRQRHLAAAAAAAPDVRKALGETLGAQRRITTETLRKHPAAMVEAGLASFRPYLEADPAVLAYFEEVVNDARN